mmetsp:Transcript_7822/g.10735  ORF Transcript_7822/g.10735 Transcript_7822/m.10735 type:complete len:295 (-) Transcript_7822:118-1002(-)|eukprot:CAMPEP_0185277952 /NCGR_PEP_ID=MMETSP1359-20130426/59829_1 /TAXON_ID=552665 /ORGANISM="Bigelowiella longifila, Strain CCMP242" /LENGTH=294 /DNA_ID=CAMNT_0027872271 /DNA_START=1 /DNA_END=885 /DNA_ORIENTATION=+
MYNSRSFEFPPLLVFVTLGFLLINSIISTNVKKPSNVARGTSARLRRPFCLPTLPQRNVVMTAEVSNEKKTWDFPRFIQTVATFNPLPSPVQLIQKALGASEDRRVVVAKNQDIWNAKNPLKIYWASLDDVVMGGVSRSKFVVGDEYASFSGFVDEANNGGFTGVRTLPLDRALDLSGATGLRLRVKGDGKRYKCVIRDSSDFNGVAWTIEYDVRDSLKRRGGAFGGNSWQTIDLPFSKFIATKYADTLTDESLDKSQIWAIQLVLSKYAYDGKLNRNFRPGEMELLVQSISVY